MPDQIEAILFDMGGTLRRTRKRSREERLMYTGEILRLLGYRADPAKFSRLLARRLTAYRHWARETMIELNEFELWTHWLLPDWPESQVYDHALELNRLWREATGERIIFPEAAVVLLELFRRGYRLGLVSNTTSSTEAPDALKKLGLSGYFETMILSAVVGKRKPDPGILLEATGRMGIAPDKCAYVGDLPHRDVAAARKAAFSKTILVRNRSGGGMKPAGDPHLQPDYDIRNLMDLLDIFPARTPPKATLVYTASVSTMWAMKNFHSLEDFIEVGRRIGFDRVELNHQVDSTMLAGINFNDHQVSSIHEPCPADISVAELKKRDWLISATDEACRWEGVKSVQRSIDLAHQLRAHVVVIHSGSVHPDRSLEDLLRNLYKAGQNLSPEYQDLQNLLRKNRRELAPPRMNAVKKSLAELLDYAGGSGIRLGLENRYHYLEFPSPDELEELLGLASPDRLGFIYDVGHAQALSRLGFYPHDEWLKRFAPRIIATHLHDVIGLQDHRIPGQGNVDFDMIAAYLPKEALRTLEFQGHHTHEQVKTGLMFLEQHGCIEAHESEVRR
jgi:FMN phosphatase YigB (HAD superfamily)/sugar phosphate isomerase/epimerase